MAKYGGFFLKGLAGGIESGVSMGLKIQEWKWQKDQKKKIEEKQEKMKEALSIYGNQLMAAYTEGHGLSEQENLKFTTALMAFTEDAYDKGKAVLDDVRAMNKKGVEEYYKTCDMIIDRIGDLGTENMQDLLDEIENIAPSENARAYLDAGVRLEEKKFKAAKAGKPEVFTSPDELLKVHPGSEWKYSADAGGYIRTFAKPETPKVPGITDYNSVASYLSKFAKTAKPETFNKVKAGLQNQFPNIDMSSITQESLREPEKVAGVEKPVKRTDIEYWRNRENTVKSEEDWDRYLFDLKQSKSPYKTKDATWEDRLLRDVKDLESGIKNQLLDKEGKMKLLNEDGTPKEIYFGGKKMTVEEAYTTLQKLYEEKVRELMEKYPDVADISTLVKFLSLEEVGKVTGWDWISRAKGYKPGETKDVSLISKY